MSGDDHAFSMLGTTLDDRALDIRQILDVDLHPQIATRDHNAIRFPDDLLQVSHAFLVLDLCDNLHSPDLFTHQCLELLNIRGFTNERKRDEVHIPFQAEQNILGVLLRNRRQIDTDSREIDVALALQEPTVHDTAPHVALFLLQHLQVDQPVIHSDLVPDVDLFKQVRIVDVDRAFLNVHRPARGDGDNGALPQIEVVGEVPGAHRRTLRNQEDRDGKLDLLVECLNVLNDLGVGVVVAV